MNAITMITAIATMLAISPIYIIAEGSTCASSENTIIDTDFIKDKDPLIQEVYWLVFASIQNLENLPGIKDFPEVREKVYVLKSDLQQRWADLVEKGVITKEESDKDGRPYTVLLQAIIEHVLPYEQKNKRLKLLKGVIHTPMPATSFCTTTDTEILKTLIDPSIQVDPLRLATVVSRSIIDRDYLNYGTIDIVYPKEGKSRTEEQLKIYREALEEYPNLKDHPLHCVFIPQDLTGAYYTFEDHKGKKFAFAMKAAQANDPKTTVFGLWFGELKASTPVYERILEVEQFIKEHSFSS
jgi:DNA-binding MarR family transcriptional regulator